MADADDSYDLENLGPFLERLRDGDDLVMGNRFAGGIEPGAMPWLHRHVGNPVLSGIGRLFFRTPVRDFHCGIRGFRKDAILGSALRRGRHGVRERDGREGEPRRAAGSARCPPRCAPTAAAGRRTCAASATAGAICASCCCSAHAGFSSYPGLIALALGLVGSDARSRSVTSAVSTSPRCSTPAALMIIGYQALWFGLLMQTYADESRDPARRERPGLPCSAGARARPRARWSAPACIVFGVIVALLSVLRWRAAELRRPQPRNQRPHHHADDPRSGDGLADDPRQLLRRRARHPHVGRQPGPSRTNGGSELCTAAADACVS